MSYGPLVKKIKADSLLYPHFQVLIHDYHHAIGLGVDSKGNIIHLTDISPMPKKVAKVYEDFLYHILVQIEQCEKDNLRKLLIDTLSKELASCKAPETKSFIKINEKRLQIVGVLKMPVETPKPKTSITLCGLFSQFIAFIQQERHATRPVARFGMFP